MNKVYSNRELSDKKLEGKFNRILKEGLRDLYRDEIKDLIKIGPKVETPKASVQKTVEIPGSQLTKARRDSIRRCSQEEINNQISSQWKNALRKKEQKRNNNGLFIGIGAAIFVALLVISYVGPISTFQGNEPVGKVPPKTTTTPSPVPVKNVSPEGNVSPQVSPEPNQNPTPASSSRPYPQPYNPSKAPSGPSVQTVPPIPPVLFPIPSILPEVNIPAPTKEKPSTSPKPKVFDQTDSTPGGSSQKTEKTPDSEYGTEAPKDDSQSNNSSSIDLSPAENPVGTIE